MGRKKRMRLNRTASGDSVSSTSSENEEVSRRNRKIPFATESRFPLASPSSTDYMDIGGSRLSADVRKRLLDKNSIRDPYGADANLPHYLLRWIQATNLGELDLNEVALLLGGSVNLFRKQIRKYTYFIRDFEEFLNGVNEPEVATEEAVDQEGTERKRSRVSRKRKLEKITETEQSKLQLHKIRECSISLRRVDGVSVVPESGICFNPSIVIKQEPVDCGYDAVENSQDSRVTSSEPPDNGALTAPPIDVNDTGCLPGASNAEPVVDMDVDTGILPDSQDSGIGSQSQQTIQSEVPNQSQISYNATVDGEETFLSQASVQSEGPTFHTENNETNDTQIQTSTQLSLDSQNTESNTVLQCEDPSGSVCNQSTATATALLGTESTENLNDPQEIEGDANRTHLACGNSNTRSLRDRNSSVCTSQRRLTTCNGKRVKQSLCCKLMPVLAPYFEDQPQMNDQDDCPLLQICLTRSRCRRNSLHGMGITQEMDSVEELRLPEANKENECSSVTIPHFSLHTALRDLNVGADVTVDHHNNDMSVASLVRTLNESNIEVSVESSRMPAPANDGEVPCCSKSLVPNHFPWETLEAFSSFCDTESQSIDPNVDRAEHISHAPPVPSNSDEDFWEEDDDVIMIEATPTLSSQDQTRFDSVLTAVHDNFSELVFGTEISSNRIRTTQSSIRRSLKKLKHILLTRYEGFPLRANETFSSSPRLNPNERLKEMIAEKSKCVNDLLNKLGVQMRRFAVCTKYKDAATSTSQSVLAGELDLCRADSKKILEEQLKVVMSKIVTLFRGIPLEYTMYAEPSVIGIISRIRSCPADWREVDLEVLEKRIIYVLTIRTDEMVQIKDLFVTLNPANTRELVGYAIAMTSLLASKCVSIVDQGRGSHSVMDMLIVNDLQSTKESFQDAVDGTF